MSTVGNWRGPDIVKDGLVLYLDAGSPNSFPLINQSTTWKDISGNGYNGTLTNGPTFNSNNGGSILFDGVNDYIPNSPYPIITTGSMTYEIVFKPNATPGNGPLGTSDIVSTVPYFYLDYGGGNLRTYHFGSSPQYFTVQSLSVGSIYHFVCTRDGLIEKNYINGTPTLGRTLSNSSGNNNGYGLVGGFPGLGWYFNCNIYVIRSYNRPISDSEVLQNYNSQKSRFGL